VAKGVVAYATAKAAVVQMTKALGLELGFKGIRVNAIALHPRSSPRGTTISPSGN
jgi:NAD(P)-dependent dehydrogenase (short-subunit alcohol dehydrogenase family)